MNQSRNGAGFGVDLVILWKRMWSKVELWVETLVIHPSQYPASHSLTHGVRPLVFVALASLLLHPGSEKAQQSRHGYACLDVIQQCWWDQRTRSQAGNGDFAGVDSVCLAILQKRQRKTTGKRRALLIHCHLQKCFRD